MDDNGGSTRYNKRPLWQWVLIYGIIGLIVYGLIYYFLLSRQDNADSSTPQFPEITSSPVESPQATASAQIEQTTITFSQNGFSPANLTIKAGDTVTWINQSGTDATVNSSPHPTHTDYQPLNLGAFANGQSLSLIFDQPGTYKYHNHFNARQFGTIVVE